MNIGRNNKYILLKLSKKVKAGLTKLPDRFPWGYFSVTEICIRDKSGRMGMYCKYLL